MSLIPEIVNTFRQLQQDAREAGEVDATAMTLATANADGQPSARTVLLKDMDERGFVFYTNSQSDKGVQLEENSRAALLFTWLKLRLQVQVRVEGKVEQVSAQEADIYFATRPRGSQIGAWASAQSRPMQTRDELLQNIAQYEKLFADKPVTRPAHWTGYRVVPNRVEFWYGVDFRLHERDCWTLHKGEWTKQLLFP